VRKSAAGERTTAIRAAVAQVIPIAGTVFLGLYIVILSSTLLPTVRVMLILLLLATTMGWLLQRSFVKVYSKAQAALQETLSHPPAPRPGPAAALLPGLLREADLETVTVAPHSPGAGKLVRELRLRSRTGASVIGIERHGGSIINPGPDEELQSGDQLLLLGTRIQLESARAILLGRETAAGTSDSGAANGPSRPAA
jgi:CPA2 family monovalent cation:H+ antiporter-2